MHADLDLACRLERAEGHANLRFIEARSRVDPAAGTDWLEVAGAYALFDGSASPLTQVFGLGLSAKAGATELDRIEEFYFDRGAGVHLEISPLAGVDLTRLLVERGYRPEEQSNVMFQAVPRDAAAPPEQKIRVRECNAEESELFTQVSLEGWSDSPEAVEFLRGVAPVFAAREDAVSFVAELDGRPVAAAALCLGTGVALLAGACTIPSARRKGLQRALLDARLASAARHGCDLASLVAMPGSGSQRNAEREGFRVAYTRTKWEREAPAEGAGGKPSPAQI